MNTAPVGKLRRAWPLIDVSLSIGNTAQVAESVEAGRAELGFVEGVIDNPHLDARPVARDQLALIVGAGHPWADRTTLTAEDLRAGEWVLREEGSGTRSEFEAALRGLGVDPASLRIAMELPSNEAVRAAVEAGMGASALSASVAAPSLEAGLLRELPLRLPDRAFYALSHRERRRSRAAEALLALIAGASSGARKKA